ncbi:MAG: hypothetical protein NTW12_09790 [Deltaproteobacteria bacterium]|nr:hypothetical protein [Deltaproteobacteria bacterium]
MNGKDMFFEVRHNVACFGSGLRIPSSGDERIRVAKRSAFDGRGCPAAHLAEVVAVSKFRGHTTD